MHSGWRSSGRRLLAIGLGGLGRLGIALSISPAGVVDAMEPLVRTPPQPWIWRCGRLRYRAGPRSGKRRFTRFAGRNAHSGTDRLNSPLEGDGFELAVPQQDDHTNATIANSPVWLSTKGEPILWPLTVSLTHNDEWSQPKFAKNLAALARHVEHRFARLGADRRFRRAHRPSGRCLPGLDVGADVRADTLPSTFGVWCELLEVMPVRTVRPEGDGYRQRRRQLA